MRYVTRAKRPRSEWDEDDVHLTGQTVVESEDGWTGLYDSEGNELWRVREIGFRLED